MPKQRRARTHVRQVWCDSARRLSTQNYTQYEIMQVQTNKNIKDCNIMYKT